MCVAGDASPSQPYHSSLAPCHVLARTSPSPRFACCLQFFDQLFTQPGLLRYRTFSGAVDLLIPNWNAAGQWPCRDCILLSEKYHGYNQWPSMCCARVCMCCSAPSPTTEHDTTRVRAVCPENAHASQARKVHSPCNSPMGPCRITARVLDSWALTLIDFLSWHVVHQCAWSEQQAP